MDAETVAHASTPGTAAPTAPTASPWERPCGPADTPRRLARHGRPSAGIPNGTPR
ncbi:hypothetical protein GCM10017688_55700 [Streptomyces ramulosus]